MLLVLGAYLVPHLESFEVVVEDILSTIVVNLVAFAVEDDKGRKSVDAIALL